MKKIVALVLALMLSLCAVSALAEIKMGQSVCAAHGTKCFAVITVAMDGDKIAAAYITEFQPMDKTAAVVVPNAEVIFGAEAASLLASKRINSELYSANMAKAGSTMALADSYAGIEAFVAGKTVAELEACIASFNGDKTAAVDAVASCTLVDTLGYLQGILDAAKAAL